jgi:translocation and assembly module TamB
MRKQATRHASLAGQLQVIGPLRQPRRLHGTLNLQEFSVELQHLLVHSEGPVQLSLADEVLRIERCVIVSDQTRFTLTGTAGLEGDHPLELQANGALDLRLAQSFNPDLTAYGTSNISVRVRGTASRPVMDGQVQVAQAGISLIDMPVGLSELNGTMLFTQDRLEVQTLTGRMGGGHVSLSGFANFASGLGFNLSLDGNDVRLRYAGISATSDQTLRLTGTMQNATVAGNITITKFAQIPSADLQGLFSPTAAPAIPNPKSPLNNVHLEVRILSTPELTVETSLAKLSGDVDLRLRGTAARPVLLGRITIAEGDVRLAGTKYHLERGDVTFINPVRIDPVLDVEATTRVRDYDITIGLHGTIERLNTTYRSDPPLTTDDIISLLAFGRTQTENALGTGGANPGFAESASGALLTSAFNQAVGNRVSKIFGYSTIRINPSLGGPENDPNARLTLEQQVSKDITFTYITNLARSAQEVIQFEYNINSEYTLQGIRDENGVVSFDLLIRKRRP